MKTDQQVVAVRGSWEGNVSSGIVLAVHNSLCSTSSYFTVQDNDIVIIYTNRKLTYTAILWL